MPWSVSDVDKHKKGLDDKQKELWVTVANGALERCLGKVEGAVSDEQRSKCEGSAIRQGNAVAGRAAEVEAECDCEECEDLSEATWTTAFVNNLPDSSFALVLPGGEKDEEGKTVPRSLRKLPYKDAGGKVDPAHLRNALARAPQMTDVSDAQRAKAIAVLKRAAEEHLKTYQKEFGFEEVGKRLNKSQMDELRSIRDKVDKLITWGDYADAEPETQAAELAESAIGHVIGLAEQHLPLSELAGRDNLVPLHLDVALIRPGWGNKRDNHYYSAEVLARDAKVFTGAKMYESDHREGEKSTRTWVSTVKGIQGMDADGAPIALVSVHDRNFAERLMALAADGLLGKMECSILASGSARKGEVNGRKGHIVEAITSAESVDWVTRGGAGGRALQLMESEDNAYQKAILAGYKRYWEE
jgi:hypothetical protein